MIGVAKWVPTNHTSTITVGLGKFIYVIGTTTKFNFGSHVFEKTMKHAQSFIVKMPIAFPSIICGVILSQHPGILTENDVACKRESPLSLHHKLFQGTNVTDIVITSINENASSTSKEGICKELKAMSKTLEETIRTSTERKISVDKMILTLSTEDGELEKGVAEENGAAASNNDEEVA